MLTVSTSIGTSFEEIILKSFPDFHRIGEDSNLPDFFSEKGKFWIEAKVGYTGFGVRLKDYQIKCFKKLSEPVIYIVGFHGLANSIAILGPKTEKQRQAYLRKHLDVARAYTVSSKVIEGIFNAENRRNRKGTIHYCMLKERFLRNTINNTPFERNGRWFTPEQKYKVCLDDLLLQLPQLNGSTNSFPYGCLLDTSQQEVIDYFTERKIISDVPF